MTTNKITWGGIAILSVVLLFSVNTRLVSADCSGPSGTGFGSGLPCDNSSALQPNASQDAGVTADTADRSPSSGLTTGGQGFVPLEPIKGLYDNASGPGGLGNVLNTIFNFGLGIAALLAVLMITWGGFKYMLVDTPFGKEDGRDIITSSIYGLLIILLSYILLVTINPQIVKNNSLLGGPSATPSSNTAVTPGSTVTNSSVDGSATGKTDATGAETGTGAIFDSSSRYTCFSGSGSIGVSPKYSSLDSCEAECNVATLCKVPGTSWLSVETQADVDICKATTYSCRVAF